MRSTTVILSSYSSTHALSLFILSVYLLTPPCPRSISCNQIITPHNLIHIVTVHLIDIFLFIAPRLHLLTAFLLHFSFYISDQSAVIMQSFGTSHFTHSLFLYDTTPPYTIHSLSSYSHRLTAPIVCLYTSRSILYNHIIFWHNSFHPFTVPIWYYPSLYYTLYLLPVTAVYVPHD